MTRGPIHPSEMPAAGVQLPPFPPTGDASLDAAVRLIAHFEGVRLTAYQDSVGVWTVGYGHTAGAFKGTEVTGEQAKRLLIQDAQETLAAVRRLVRPPLLLTPGQEAALTSFAFNLGAKSLASSTLLQCLNKGDVAAAADQFLRWDHAGGKQLAGLTRRRQAERALFLNI